MGLRNFMTHHCTDTEDTQMYLKEDAVYCLLSARRRQLVIVELNDRDGNVSVSELVRAVAASETGVEPFAVTEDVYQRYYISVYQSHLPTLSDRSVVDWQRERGRVHAEAPVGPLATIIRDIPKRTEIPNRGELGFPTLTLRLSLVGPDHALARPSRRRDRSQP